MKFRGASVNRFLKAQHKKTNFINTMILTNLTSGDPETDNATEKKDKLKAIKSPNLRKKKTKKAKKKEKTLSKKALKKIIKVLLIKLVAKKTAAKAATLKVIKLKKEVKKLKREIKKLKLAPLVVLPALPPLVLPGREFTNI
jgi:hypothetical protein